MGTIFLLMRIALDRKEIKQRTDIFLLGGSDAIIYCFIIKQLARNLQTIVRYTVDNVSFQPCESFQQQMRLSVCFTYILQICSDIFIISQYSLLAHTFYCRNDFTLAQSQHIRQIVYTRLCLLVLTSRDVFLCNKRFDDTYHPFYFIARKKTGTGNTLAGLIHILDRNSSCINMRYIIASLYIPTLLQSRKGSPYTCLYI